MERTVEVLALRRDVSHVLEEVRRGDNVIIEDNGEPVAAVVPIELFYEQWKRRRDLFFAKVQ